MYMESLAVGLNEGSKGLINRRRGSQHSEQSLLTISNCSLTFCVWPLSLVKIAFATVARHLFLAIDWALESGLNRFVGSCRSTAQVSSDVQQLLFSLWLQDQLTTFVYCLSLRPIVEDTKTTIFNTSIYSCCCTVYFVNSWPLATLQSLT